MASGIKSFRFQVTVRLGMERPAPFHLAIDIARHIYVRNRTIESKDDGSLFI